MIQLDQVPAGIGAHGDAHRPRLHRLLREHHAQSLQPGEFSRQIVDFERGERNALLEDRVLERLAGGVGVRLERELEIVASGGDGLWPGTTAGTPRS